MKKLISWNVNGIRAAIRKGFVESIAPLDADIIALQEIKLSKGQLDFELPGYYLYWHYAEKKGYSGTAVFTKEKPIQVTYGIGLDWADSEGRVITAEYDDFFFVNVYTPNAQPELARIELRMLFEDALRDYLGNLAEKKGVILCGDLNVAHQEIDLKNPKTNRGNPGFSDQERKKFTTLLDSGFIDTFRFFFPDLEGAYSWWSYRFNARQNNAGWRIDYFCVSENFKNHIQDAKIHSDILGSDHCPVELIIK